MLFATLSVLMSNEESTRAIAGPRPPANLRVEYLHQPLGLDAQHPRFSWEVSDDREGARQSAYEIQVLKEGRPIWKSGKVVSAATTQVRYAGPDLQAFSRYEWKVRSWDGKNVASDWTAVEQFGIGGRKNQDWKASWITDTFKLKDRQKANNGYHSEFTSGPDVDKWVKVDLGSVQPLSEITLFPTRPYDWVRDAPGFLFPVRFVVEIAKTEDFNDAVVVADHRDADFRNPGTNYVKFSANNVEARWVRVRVTKVVDGDKGRFGFTLAELEVRSRGKVVKGVAAASDSLNSGAWHINNLVDGDTISHPAGGDEAAPPFEAVREFVVKKPIKSATLYATARGAYQWEVTSGNAVANGNNLWLAPEWTDYFSRIQYQAHDFTKLLKRGKNSLLFLVGDGWYSGRIGMSQSLHPSKWLRGVYGRRPELLAELHIVYKDGSEERVVTDQSWQVRTSTSIISSDIYDGEAQDRTAKPGAWTKPRVKALDKVPLVAQTNEPIRTEVNLAAHSVNEPKPGVYVFDMGQNMVGTIEARFHAKPGATVRFRYAEMLNDDGTIYTENLRGAPQIDTVRAAGGKAETFTTHFTYHGFRFVEVTGVDKPMAKGDVEGVVFYSSSPITAEFQCSDPQLNQIFKNVMWTHRANLMSSPTDCPQRDERLGWMGDILVFGQASIFNMDMAGFYTKWLQDVRDAQAKDGRMPDIAPHPYGKDLHFTGAPGWGDAGVVVPWRVYENYGDKQILADSFESCRRWVEWIASKNPDHLWTKNRGNNYNDWLNGDTLIAEGWPRTGGTVPHDVFATIMFYLSTDLTARMAEVLERPDAGKYRTLANDIQAAFVAKYLAEDGTILGDTQAGYSLALFYEIVPKNMEDKVFDKMVAALEKYGGKMSTGFHSSHALMLELSKRGRNDLAYRLAQTKEFPSWGYSISQGATTIWERWDGFVKGRGFQDPGMNSFNHWAFGAVTEWLMRVVGGLNPGAPGKDWRDFVVEPKPGGGLSYADSKYRSHYGLIESSWKITGNRFELKVRVPANTQATVKLPDGKQTKVRAGVHSFSCAWSANQGK